MTRILFLFLLLPFAASSQHIQSDQTDDFGHLRRIATSRVEFQGLAASLGGTLVIQGCDTAVHLNLFFRAGKPVSLGGSTTAVLHLENGETLQVSYHGKDRQLTATEPGFFYFIVSAAQKAKLETYKVVGYTIQLTNTSVDVALQNHQQQAFDKTIALLQSRARLELPTD